MTAITQMISAMMVGAGAVLYVFSIVGERQAKREHAPLPDKRSKR